MQCSYLDSDRLDNANPVVHEVERRARVCTGHEHDDSVADPIDADEVFDLIRDINDPEHPLTLEQLQVVESAKVDVDDAANRVHVTFTPTIPHCSMATLIGLSIKVKLLRSLPPRFKIMVSITEGSHNSELAINKQLADKERVAAAMENSHLIGLKTQTLSRVDTGETADTLEWNHFDPRFVVCGTYQLDAQEERRHGRLILFERLSDGLEAPKQIFATPSRPGVFDCSWISPNTLVSADSDGYVSVHCLSKCSLSQLSRCCVVEDGMVLSVDRCSSHVCVSDSTGHVGLLDASCTTLVSCWAAHDFEAWFSSLSPHDSTLASGGDDCRLRLWDTRTCSPQGGVRLDMGVTCATWHPMRAETLAVGSYDERLRLFDRRKLGRAINEVVVGGGVWRAKWGHGERILVAAMHAGFAVVGTEVEVRYEEHESLGYGADWLPVEEDFLVGTASFYDHALHFWSLTA